MVPLDRQSVPRPARLDKLGRTNAKDKNEPLRTELDRARDHFGPPSKAGKFEFSVYSDPEVKEALSKLSGGKCAYCEYYYDAGQPADVEHYRPKGRIDSPNGKLPGYWWLASDWDNLLPSCIRCNRPENLRLYDGTEMPMGKGDRFPIDDENVRAGAEGQHAGEQPLLLNPCDDDPRDYLRFVEKDQASVVIPKEDGEESLAARRARQSIDIYGLNREGLVTDRTREMVQIKLSLVILAKLVHLLEQNPPDPAMIEDLMAIERQKLDLHRAPGARYAAMARTLIDPVLKKIDPLFAAGGEIREYRWP
ncbi:MAG TPA: hypothetical protein VGW40_15955 [Allosphingosinicella sp.]|nr:hypothetical protein [Allosphingosinicella sp.]